MIPRGDKVGLGEKGRRVLGKKDIMPLMLERSRPGGGEGLALPGISNDNNFYHLKHCTFPYQQKISRR